MPKDDLSGRIFGRLTVEKFAGYPKHAPSKAQWVCACSCGQAGLVVYGYNLKNGNTNSCGCFKIEATKKSNSTHGQSKTLEYAIYHGMLLRCYDKKNARYPLYGGRGIKVHRRWRGADGFINFIADMGPRPSRQYSVERENNNRGYGPNNCVWATNKQQCRNTRKTRFVVFRGRRMPLIEACELADMPYTTVYFRVAKAGWSVKQALTVRVRCYGGVECDQALGS